MPLAFACYVMTPSLTLYDLSSSGRAEGHYPPPERTQTLEHAPLNTIAALLIAVSVKIRELIAIR